MERSRPWGDGVVTGFGEIDGRQVAVFSQDFTVFGGSLGEAFAEKIVKLMDLAERYGCPIIGINDSAGARIQEGVEGLAGYGEVFFRNVRASGVVPQISIIAGPCAGGAVYSPAMTDFVFMVDGIEPDVHHRPGRDQDRHRRGGHARGARRRRHPRTRQRRRPPRRRRRGRPERPGARPALLPPVEQPRRSAPTSRPADDPTARRRSSTPWSRRRARSRTTCTTSCGAILDDGDFFEVQRRSRRRTSSVGFGRLDGHSVGVVANQPSVLAGTLDIDASDQGGPLRPLLRRLQHPARHLRRRARLPARASTRSTAASSATARKLLYAFAEATVPKVTVITRKAYGGAYVVMCSKHIGADFNVAWPTAEIAVMGPDAAVGLIFRRELAAADDPASAGSELVAEYEDLFASPYQAASRGYIDDVIEPRQTRPALTDPRPRPGPLQAGRDPRPQARKHPALTVRTPMASATDLPFLPPHGVDRPWLAQGWPRAGRSADVHLVLNVTTSSTT